MCTRNKHTGLRGGKRCPRPKASLVPAHPRTATSMLKSQAQPSDLSSLFWSPGRANPHLSGFGYGDTWDPKIGALSLQTLMTFTSTHTPSPAPWPGQKLPWGLDRGGGGSSFQLNCLHYSRLLPLRSPI